MAERVANRTGMLGFAIALSAVIASPMLFGLGYAVPEQSPSIVWHLSFVPDCNPIFVGDCAGHQKFWVGHHDGAAIYAVTAGVVLVAVVSRRFSEWLKRQA